LELVRLEGLNTLVGLERIGELAGQWRSGDPEKSVLSEKFPDLKSSESRP